MLLALAFMLPPVAVLACLGLNRFISTRWCAFGTALGLAFAAACLVGVRISGQSMALIDLPLFELTERAIHLSLRLDPINWPITIVILAGGALMVAALGFALPADLRGFSGLPATLALVVVTTLLSMATTDPILRPVAWMMAVFASATALRASGALADSDAPLIVALAGVVATMLLLATGLLITSGVPLSTMALLCLTIACLLLLGCAPFNAVAGAMSEAPAGIGGALLALGLPLVGGQTLLTMMTEVGFPAPWRTALGAGLWCRCYWRAPGTPLTCVAAWCPVGRLSGCAWHRWPSGRGVILYHMYNAGGCTGNCPIGAPYRYR